MIRGSGMERPVRLDLMDDACASLLARNEQLREASRQVRVAKWFG